MDDVKLEFDGTVEQRLVFHMMDDTQWNVTVNVESLAQILEGFRDKEIETIHVHGNSGEIELNWYLRRENIIAINVINLEDWEGQQNARGGALPPPAKSRKRAR